MDRRMGSCSACAMAVVLGVLMMLSDVTAYPPSCHCPPEIDLPPFSIFVRNNFDGDQSDNEGRLAVGGTADMIDYSVGNSLENSHGTRNDTIVGGDLNWTRGQTFNGNIVVGGTATLQNVGIPNGELYEGVSVPVNFEEEFARLRVLSANIGSVPATGEIVKEYSSLTLKGEDPTCNFWNIDAATLAATTLLTIAVPEGSSGVVNVFGDVIAFDSMGVVLAGGAVNERVLYNFFQAEMVSIHSITVKGSVLAPFAKLQFDNGNVEGSIYVEEFAGTGETHLFEPVPVSPPCPSCEDCADMPASETEWELSFVEWEYSTNADRTSFTYSLYTVGSGDPKALEVCDEGHFGVPQCDTLAHWDLGFDIARAEQVLYTLSYPLLEIGEDASVTYNGGPFYGAIFTTDTNTVGHTILFTIVVEGKACYSPVPYVVKGLSKCGSGVIDGPDFTNLEPCDFTPPPSDCVYNEVVVRVPLSHLCAA